MCLAIPGKVISWGVAVADFGGLQREIRLDLLEGVREGDYVLVHTGYAIERVDEGEARRILELRAEIEEAIGAPEVRPRSF